MQWLNNRRAVRHDSRRVRLVLITMAAVAVSSGACGDDATSVPDSGSIHVQTETAGFDPDDAYVLLIDGQDRGPIGANADVTISELAPEIYLVDLGDVADNCEDAPTLARVGAGETVEVLFSVTCGLGEPSQHTLAFEDEEVDLDTQEVTACSLTFCGTGAGPDLHVAYNSTRTIHSVIVQNQSGGVEIAHLAGVTLDELTEEDVMGATFTTSLVDESFDGGRVILIRTDLGATYALGNPVETTQRLTFDAVLVASP